MEPLAQGALPLWRDDDSRGQTVDGFVPHLIPFVVPGARRGAVVVCPGGGYQKRAPHEGDAIARRFNEAGMHAFVLHYRVAPNRHPGPLQDVSRALRIVRHRAREWGVRPDHLAVCGFSAGGHLAASAGVFHSPGAPEAADPVDRLASRPDAMILCYPVISSGPGSHGGSYKNLLGEDATDEARRMLSLEIHASETTPPAFLWHTFDDPLVPVENSVLFAQALARFGTPYELHIFPTGRHGLGLAHESPHVARWMDLCLEWLAGQGW